MQRFVLSLLTLVLAAPLARAHFIWLVPDKDGTTFQVVFSDTPQPDDAKLLAKIAHTKWVVRGPEGKTVDLKWKEEKDGCSVTPSGSGTRILAGICNYGVIQRGKDDPFLLKYYATAPVGPKGELANEPWEEMPLQIVQHRHGYQVLWQGKPLADAEVAISLPGKEKAEESKSDADGLIKLGKAEPGMIGIRVRYVEKKEGKHEDKEYKQVRHYATRALLVAAADKAPDAKADPAATKLLAEARSMRAVWNNFPGFTADVAVNFDGKSGKGKVRVSAGGKEVTIEGLPKEFEQWTRRELESLVNHRLPGGGDRETPCAFTDDVTDHPLGREIRVLNDELHSGYRVRDKEIVVVNRTMKDRRFTITVLESIKNKEGKFLTTSFTVDYWNLETNDLVRSDAESQTWGRVGDFDLPGLTRVVTVRGKSFGGEAAKEDAFTAKSLQLTNHKLLEAGTK